MSLIFGNLTQQFINFAMTIEANSSPEKIEEAASNFRRAAAKDASDLVYIGQFLAPLNDRLLTVIYRYRPARCDLHIYVILELHRRNQCQTTT